MESSYQIAHLMLSCFSDFYSLHTIFVLVFTIHQTSCPFLDFSHFRLRCCQDPSPGVEILLVDEGEEDINEGGDVDHQRHHPLQHGEQGDRLLLLLKYVHSIHDVLLVLGKHVFS